MKTKLYKLELGGTDGYFIADIQEETDTIKKYDLLKCLKYGHEGFLVHDFEIYVVNKELIVSEEFLFDWDTDFDFISLEYKETVENANFYIEKMN